MLCALILYRKQNLFFSFSNSSERLKMYVCQMLLEARILHMQIVKYRHKYFMHSSGNTDKNVEERKMDWQRWKCRQQPKKIFYGTEDLNMVVDVRNIEIKEVTMFIKEKLCYDIVEMSIVRCICQRFTSRLSFPE